MRVTFQPCGRGGGRFRRHAPECQMSRGAPQQLNEELIPALDEIRRQPGTAPTEDEIQAEIDAVRKRRRVA